MILRDDATMRTCTRRFSGLSLAFALACSSSGGDDPSAASATEGSPTSDDPEGSASASADDDPSTPDDDGTSAASAPTGADSADDGDDGTSMPAEPGPDVAIDAFDGEHMYWSSDDDHHREVDVALEFPAGDAAYATISLELGVRCPEGGCDYWDRLGSLAIVQNEGQDDEYLVEIARFVTPYRVEGAWSIDLSYLRPLLTGPRTLRLFVDTWVGPGSAQGEGWLVDARFDFVGGVASPRPIAVIPIYTRRAYEVGNPDAPIADAVPPTEIVVPDGTTSATLVSIITGHGQGNAENCAEFCQDNHGYLVGGSLPIQRTVWRNDCDDNPIDAQIGNWAAARAGWCPGADVVPWIEDVTEAVTAGKSMSIEYAVSPYENTCRPGAATCEGCALLTTCEYDGNNHTEPQVRMSTLLVAWAD